MVLFAQLLSVIVRRGDLIALEGEVGAGKTTFARAFIRAFLGGRDEEIPSPTYTLVQTYNTPRMNIAHFDLYRLGDPSELTELGLDHALDDSIALVEWPSHGGDWLPHDRLILNIIDPMDEPSQPTRDSNADNDTRDILLTGFGHWENRLKRLRAMYELIKSSGWYQKLSAISYLAGDASARRYARLFTQDKHYALVMDWPHVRENKILRDGKTYNQLAHIADNVAPFVAVSNALRSQDFSAPEIFAADLDNGFLILEDLGARVFFDEVQQGMSMDVLWQAATDTLVALRGFPVPDVVEVSGQLKHNIPAFDRSAMLSELALLADWYWPQVHGSLMPEDKRQQFFSIWDVVIDGLENDPDHWCLRDYHSPNLVWLPERRGVRGVGIIDFQDACRGPAAYDLVSLLQDARVSVPESLETQLIESYCEQVRQADSAFDRTVFVHSYAIMGAQRNTKILGIFARLAERDGKPHYLAHIPRIWGYLNRNLQHPKLRDLANWYEDAFDKQIQVAPFRR